MKKNNGSPLVLVADNDQALLDQMRHLLEPAGFEIVIAKSGDLSLKAFDESLPDIVMVDVNLPGINGCSLCKEFRKRPAGKYVPIILMADKTDDASIKIAYDDGASDFFIKQVFLDDSINKNILPYRLRCLLRAKKDEVNFRESILKFELMAENIREVVWMCSADGTEVIYMSPAYEKIWGHSREQLYANPDLLIKDIHPSDQKQITDAFSKYALNGLDYTEEYRIVRPDGELRWIKDHGFPVYDDDGNHQFIAGTAEDITDRKQAESSLRISQKLEAVGNLAAGIAHEINTPSQYVGDNLQFLNESFDDLTKVLNSYSMFLTEARNTINNTELLTSIETTLENADLDYLIEEIPKAITQSQDGIQQIASIVKAMKDFSHPGKEEMELVDVNKVINNSITISRNEWKYIAEIKRELDENLPSIFCHQQMLGQVILNLIINAAHAISEAVEKDSTQRGVITIKTERLGELIQIKITDTGGGIPDAIVDKVFDPFFTTKEMGKGTGQGLSMARNTIVECHNGALDIKSEIGKGTIIVIRLRINNSKDLM